MLSLTNWYDVYSHRQNEIKSLYMYLDKSGFLTESTVYISLYLKNVSVFIDKPWHLGESIYLLVHYSTLLQSSVPCVPPVRTRTRWDRARVRTVRAATTAPPARTAAIRARRGRTQPLMAPAVSRVGPPLSAPVWAAPPCVITLTFATTWTVVMDVFPAPQVMLGMESHVQMLMR